MSNKTTAHNNKKLSIQLSSDGFSFCIYNNATHKYEHVETITFSYKCNTPSTLLNEVQNVFKSNILLHETYEELILIHHNELNTFVPHLYFDEELLHQYLQNTVKVFDNDFISFDELNTLKVNNVYIPFVNINNYIFESFGEFTYLHSSTVFLQNILKTNNITNKSMFVNINQNNFQLIVIENNQLQLSNYFDYNSKEDFVYYILFVAEQLKMDTNSFNLTLYGNIKENDETYKLIYQYVRNVNIYSNLNTALDSNITTLPQIHFNLLQLHS